MSVGTLARYTTIAGLKVPVQLIAKGHDQYGAVMVLRVTSTPVGKLYRKGEILTVSADSQAVSER